MQTYTVMSHPRRDQGRRRILGAAVVVLAVAATATWVTVRSDAAEDRILVVDEDGAVSLLDPETGESLYEVSGATATPDRSALLTTESTDGKTLLQSRDPVTGAVTGTTMLDGDLTVRTVSPKGGAVALMPGPKGVGLYEAGAGAPSSPSPTSTTGRRAPTTSPGTWSRRCSPRTRTGSSSSSSSRPWIRPATPSAASTSRRAR
jgi:hypothetical protein